MSIIITNISKEEIFRQKAESAEGHGETPNKVLLKIDINSNDIVKTIDRCDEIKKITISKRINKDETLAVREV